MIVHRRLELDDLYDVTIGLLCGDFIFYDVRTVLYVIKIVTGFYKVQNEHIKRGVVGCVYVFVSNSQGIG